MEDRVILHSDLNNFYASVEIALDPSLKGKAVAVTGNPEARHGIILAKSNLAKKYGVKTGEAIWEAKIKCPELICVAPHYNAYVYYSKIAREIYYNYTDLIEAFGIDECWLDVTHSKIFGDGETIANKIRKDIFDRTNLTVSVGVSFNKVFAKIGSDLKKPDATTLITKENFKQIIWQLNADEMLMIGKKTYEKLNSLNIFTIGDIANSDRKLLHNTFGISGDKMFESANGLENSPVTNVSFSHCIKSVGHGTTTIRDVCTIDDAKVVIYFLSEMIATRLRRYGLCGLTVSIDLRSNDLLHKTRQCSMSSPTMVAGLIASTATQLLIENWKPATDLPLRTITVSISSLNSLNEATQESFFVENNNKSKSLEFTLDKIRTKYGFNSVTRANILNNDYISDKFLEEDDLLPFKR